MPGDPPRAVLWSSERSSIDLRAATEGQAMTNPAKSPPRKPTSDVSMPATPWFVALGIVLSVLLLLRLFLG